jgi:LPS-assembly protein
MLKTVLPACVVCLWCTCAVSAQSTPPATTTTATPGLLQMLNSQQQHYELVDANHLKLTGAVALEPQPGVKLYADGVDVFLDTHKLVAAGNVVFSNPEGRLSAERTEFDLDTGTGTFYDASGIMALGKRAKPAQFGDQDPDVYFYGEKIEKLGARRYRITRGGFSTCVQPTPRWEVTSGTVILDLDDHALATNTVLHVKGVPLLYLPVIYYPISSTQRQTGFLLPTYGTSTVRGQALSNAFFWAIGRSQDATFFHDWFTRAGTGEGAEYRYVSSPVSSGNLRFYKFNQKTETFTTNGVPETLQPATSYELRGTMTQVITPKLRARARVDYFSNIVTQQLYNQNLYQASNSNRTIDGGLTAMFGPATTAVQYQRNQIFSNSTDSFVYGATPRVTTTVAPEQLFGSPIYGSVNTEYAFLPYRRVKDGIVQQDNSLTRVDVMPSVRVPLSRLTFLSVNTSAAYRTTYYTRSADPADPQSNTIPEGFLRQYATVRTDVVGPVFDRIWERPGSSFAERLKHVIEPAFTIDATSPIADYTRTPVLTDVSDVVVGGTARFTYGVTNRFFYRAPATNGVRGATREFITVGLQQTYYTNPLASQYDTSYVTNTTTRRESDLSPLALNVRVSPTPAVDLNSRVEYDTSSGLGLQTVSIGSNMTFGQQGASVAYSRQHFAPTAPAQTFLTGSGRVQLAGGRVTGTYALNWDIGRSYIASQRITASHMAQCCGWQVDFQKTNYLPGTGLPLPADTRLNFAFVLAGLGTFSNFFGAFGGLR